MQKSIKIAMGLFISLFAIPCSAIGLDFSAQQQTSLLQGMINAALEPKHILPAIIVGFWAAQRSTKGERWIMVAAWSIGAGLAAALAMTGNALMGSDLIHSFLMLSLFVLGIIVALPITMNIGMAVILTLFFAAMHGFGVADAAPRAAHAALYVAGGTISMAVVVCAGLLLASMVKEKAPMLPQIGSAAAAGMGLAVFFSLQRLFA